VAKRRRKPLSEAEKQKRKDRRRASKERRAERDEIARQHKVAQRQKSLERKTNYKLQVLSKLPAQRIRDLIQRCDVWTAPYGLASKIIARAFPKLYKMGLRFTSGHGLVTELRAIGACRPTRLSIATERYDKETKKLSTVIARGGEIPLSGLTIYRELYDEDPPVNKPEFIGMKAVYKYQLLIWITQKTTPSGLMYTSFDRANKVLHAQSQAQLDEALEGRGFWKTWLSSAAGAEAGVRVSGGKVKRARSKGGAIAKDGTNLEMLTVEELLKRKEKVGKTEQRKIRRLLRARGHSIRNTEKGGGKKKKTGGRKEKK